jgi:DNA-binding NarL/FixJ family response regulator
LKPERILSALLTLGRDGLALRPEAAALAFRFFQGLPFPEPPASGLSRREMDILFLHACRVRHKEIGEALRVAAKTVDNHVTSGYGKLGVHTREQLLAKLLRVE